MQTKKIAMLGGGFIGDFYIHALHGHRRSDRVQVVYSRSESSAKKVAERHGIPHWTTDMFDAMDQGKEPMETFYDDQHYLIKEEKIPDGTVKLILKDKSSGEIIQKVK